MIGKNVIVCGVCQNIAKRLPNSIQIMEKIGSLFENYKIIIYENNSSDNTKDIITHMATKNQHIVFLQENLSHEYFQNHVVNWHDDGTAFRPELIALARNKIMEKIELSEYNEYEYVIWIDVDFIKDPNYEGIIEIFENPEKDFDAVFAYGIAPDQEYHDKFAFRDKNYPLGPELLGHNVFYTKRDVLKLKPTDLWYPVYSAFGGAGVFKRRAIYGCRFSGIVTEDTNNYMKKIIEDNQSNAMVISYLNFSTGTANLLSIEKNIATDHKYKDYNNEGFLIMYDEESLVWRNSSFVYSYPCVCEHIPFLSAMFVKGFDKFYINPRLTFRY